MEELLSGFCFSSSFCTIGTAACCVWKCLSLILQ
uniref:Uncharacterized protein n=1 Tax=Rhizophora mucronata TaxID=61149 RepID=A0A2P2NNU0_RHIMU